MSPTKVAIAGATGNLGVTVLKTLLDANFEVTVLSRVGGNSSKLPSHPNLTIKEVDFTSVQSMTTALQGVEVVVSCLATLMIEAQNPLIDASVAAGVRRFIPAEFGMDSQNEKCMALPIGGAKVDTQKHLQEQVKNTPEFSYTAIANGMFLDWGLKVGFILDVAAHSAKLYNGGDVPVSGTTLADIAKAVLGVIRNQDQTANRVIYIQSALTTQNTLIRYVKEKDGKSWHTTNKDTEELRQESLAELAKGSAGDTNAAMDGFSVVALWGRGYGGDFSDHLDNHLVGIKPMNEAELRSLVTSFA